MLHILEKYVNGILGLIWPLQTPNLQTQICENCDKEFLSKDSLQGHVADGHENGDPVFDDQTKAQYKSGHCLFGKTVA